MDWSLYPNLYHYFSKLPKDVDNEIKNIESIQCINYPSKQNPVKKLERIVLPIQRITNIPSSQSNNESLWKLISNIIDENNKIYSIIFQKENTLYLIRSLKDFIIKPEIRSIITSQRMYIILELLDKPRTELTIKHKKALGYFLSFLLNSVVQIDENIYAYNSVNNTTNNTNQTISISRNSDGFWYLINKNK